LTDHDDAELSAGYERLRVLLIDLIECLAGLTR